MSKADFPDFRAKLSEQMQNRVPRASKNFLGARQPVRPMHLSPAAPIPVGLGHCAMTARLYHGSDIAIFSVLEVVIKKDTQVSFLFQVPFLISSGRLQDIKLKCFLS